MRNVFVFACGLLCVNVVCGLFSTTGCFAEVDYSQIEPPDVFIFPTPREATYGQLDIEISAPGRALAAIILPQSPSVMLQAAAEDLNTELLRIVPQVQPLPVIESGGDVPEGVATHILLGPVGSFRRLDDLLAAEGLYMTPTEPGAQGYRIVVRDEGERKVVLLAGCDDQGAYWAASSFAQLLRLGDDSMVRAYSTSVRDWPGFQLRMTTVEAVYESNYDGVQSMKQRMARVLALKYTVSCYSGDNPELNGWLRQRNFRAGTGYWTMQHISRKAAELGVKAFSWSDEGINEAWEDNYRRNAEALKPGLCIWHDCTDAGWFNKYIDKFWDNREEADREAYPDEHPARADAHRLNLIYEAVKSVSPDTDLYFTVPCYYDNPQDDNLPRIELFRDYLRTLSSLTPNDIVWVLEDRGRDAIVAYEHYLEGRCMNYRYPLPGADGFWSTNFTSAKHAARYSDSYWFCVGHYHNDLMMACAAPYMWNPDVPDDYEYITTVLVPQAAKFLYGSAWREMAEFIVNLNINDTVLREGRQVELVHAGRQNVDQAVELLQAALDKIEANMTDGRHGIEVVLSRMESVQQWLGIRLAISEAMHRCQRAETLVAFGQFDKAREALNEADDFLAELDQTEVEKYSWLKEDFAQTTERAEKLEQTIAQGGAGEGELGVLPLDGQWLFKLDPENTGIEQQWFAVDLERGDWTQIGVPGFWEQSGVAGTTPDYDGVAWYARSFQVPTNWQGLKIVLHIGACDDEAWGYVNGEFVGDHLEEDHPQTAWEDPFEFDVSEVIEWDADNLVVVRVNDTHGGGGIWKSVYLRADEPSAPAPGPGEVEIKEPNAREAAGDETPIPTAGEQAAQAPQAEGIKPGWSTVLNCPAEDVDVQITVVFRGYGGDVRNTAGRDLTDKEKQWLADNNVGKLAISSFAIGGKQIVMQNRYPGFLLGFTYSWDGYNWSYHSLDSADVTRNSELESVLCKGRSFCANYERFETWMRYEYEIGIRADGLGYERLILIPEHDTGFSPSRNGPPYGAGGGAPAIGGLHLALGCLPSAFSAILLAPFTNVPVQAIALDYASDKLVWEGNCDPCGFVGAYDPANSVYLVLMADRQGKSVPAAVRQFDAEEYPGEEMQIELLRPVVSDWPADSRNEFRRWFAAGAAEDIEAAKAALQAAQSHLNQRQE